VVAFAEGRATTSQPLRLTKWRRKSRPYTKAGTLPNAGGGGIWGASREIGKQALPHVHGMTKSGHATLTNDGYGALASSRRFGQGYPAWRCRKQRCCLISGCDPGCCYNHADSLRSRSRMKAKPPTSFPLPPRPLVSSPNTWTLTVASMWESGRE